MKTSKFFRYAFLIAAFAVASISQAQTQWTSGNGYQTTTGKVSIGVSTPPVELLQLGKEFTFHNGGTKVFGRNFDYVGPGGQRMVDGPVATMSFPASGDIHFRTAGSDLANTQISWKGSGLIMKNNGRVGIGVTSPTTHSPCPPWQ